MLVVTYQKLLDLKAQDHYENLDVLWKNLSCLQLPDLHG